MNSESTTCGNCPDVNLSVAERSLSAFVGGLFLVHSLRRRSSPGLMSLALGVGLLYRSLTGRCPLYSKLGISSAPEDLEREPEPHPRARPQASKVTDVSLAATGEMPPV